MKLDKVIMKAKRLETELKRRNKMDSFFDKYFKKNEALANVKKIMPDWSDVACIEFEVEATYTHYRHEDLYNELNKEAA